ATYTPVTADAGKKIGVRVTYTDAGGTSESVEIVTADAVLTDVVANTAPVITSNHDAAVDLAEDTAAGVTIATVTATDANSDTLIYAITAGDDDGLFTIDASGNIALATGKAVDFETAPNSYTLTVTVSDGKGGADTVDITINVTNVNEHAPVFADAAASFDLAEDAVVDAVVGTVTATDADADATLEYSIVGTGTPFKIDAATGQIKVADASGLDFETASVKTWTFNVQVTDGTNTDTIAVTIDLTNTFAANAAEAFTGDVTGTVDAADSDAASYVQTTGNLTLAGGLSGGVVSVAGMDLTDGVTTDTTASGHVIANTGEQSLVLKSGSYGNLSLFKLPGNFLNSGDSWAWTYVLNKSDAAVLALSAGESLTETFTVYYATEDEYYAPATITITIEGADDGFAFNKDGGYSFTVLEGASDIGDVLAQDWEADTQPSITYSITGGNEDGLFVIDASGKIALASGKALDYETARVHTLTITANAGTDTITTEVEVNVSNVFAANAAEAFTGDVAGTVDAADSDAVVEGTLTPASGLENGGVVSIGNGVFVDSFTTDRTANNVEIANTGGGVTLAVGVFGNLVLQPSFNPFGPNSYTWTYTLDKDRPALLELGDGDTATETFTVYYATEDEYYAPATITITVTGADDPFGFNQADGYNFDVNEGAAGAVVGNVLAKDWDHATPAEVTYSITAGDTDGLFSIGANGVITLAKAVDFEGATTKEWTLTISAVDANNAAVTTTVTVTLVDVNDEAPVIATPASTTVNVAANADAGTQLLTLTASDADAGDTLTWSIKSGNVVIGQNQFGIDQSLFSVVDGNLTLTGDWPANVTSYDLVIVVTDAAGNTDEIEVTVTDANDVAPVFDAASYTATVNENAGADTVVATVSATDADAGAVLTYRIVSGNDGAYNNAFTIDSKTGAISIVDPEDLDIVGGAPNQYTLTVEVSDGTNTATVQVTIDVNAAPIVVINPRAGDGVVAEDTLGAETGISVRFILDNGALLNIANARVTGRGGDKFELVADSDNPGFYVVKLKDDQKLSHGDDLRGLRIEATDSNGNVSNLSTSFEVSVNDVAEFDFTSGSEAKVGVALTVEKTADDADGNGTGGFSYQWYVDDAGTKTDIAGATSASFTPTSAQEGKTIGVRITYTDAESRTETVEETFTTPVAAADPVNIAPVFAESEYTASVAESLAVGVTIATVAATDADAGDTLSYSIVSGDADSLFAIDATTGVITLATGKALDYETATSYTLTVEVDDGAGGKATTTVVITVTDANEAPVITATGIGAVDENVDGADTGITLTVADPDAVDSITFAITGTGSDKFEVVAIDASDLSKGYTLKLKSGVSLNFEDAASYTLTITGTNKGSLTHNIDVTVGVTNQDDGLAIVAIAASRGDLDALTIGDTLAASITTADPDGVANGTTGTWRWFHKHNPDVTIGTGENYTLTDADRGAKIGVEYTYTDVLDAANSTTSKAIAILETELARVVVTPDAPAEDTDITLGDTDNDPQTPDVGSKVDAGDGSDSITGGAGNDEITGGKGDDKIDLGASDTDTDVVIYGIGGQSAKDGGDDISNFNRGVDQFVFSLDSNQAGVSDVSDYDSFIDYITKGTATLDDDEFRVQLDLGKDADDKTQIEGLFFHFASSSFYSGGRASLPLMKISFADPIDEAGITGIFTDENGQPVDASQVLNKYLFITDLDYLDDFMGGADSITYDVV
ncbi:cadherin domain-containing protein, partial [Alphaproteobacteria bacterium]|nr:cadherin domain-containing protein [Alphaproteobacteria bacterium]